MVSVVLYFPSGNFISVMLFCMAQSIVAWIAAVSSVPEIIFSGHAIRERFDPATTELDTVMLVFVIKLTTVVPAGIAFAPNECQLIFPMAIPTCKPAVLEVVSVVVPLAVAVI